MSLKKGDLVYIPAATRLSRYKDTSSPIVDKYQNTDKPLNLLVVEALKHKQIGVSYQGEVWYLNEKDAYLVRE